VISVATLPDPRGPFDRQAYSVVVTLEPGAGYVVGEPASAQMWIKPSPWIFDSWQERRVALSIREVLRAARRPHLGLRLPGSFGQLHFVNFSMKRAAADAEFFRRQERPLRMVRQTH